MVFPSDMDSHLGAIYLMVPVLFTVDAWVDSTSAVMEASLKLHRTALLSMTMFGCYVVRE